MSVIITKHAYKRIKERAKVKNLAAISKLADKAYIDDIRLEQSSGFEKKYITMLCKYEGREVSLYANNIFIWDNKTLVTMYKMAPDIIRKFIKIKQKRKMQEVL